MTIAVHEIEKGETDKRRGRSTSAGHQIVLARIKSDKLIYMQVHVQNVVKPAKFPTLLVVHLQMH